LSKIDLEVSDDIKFEDGDCAVVIKTDGSIGRVIVPDMNKDYLNTEGYRKLLDVIDVLDPGSKEKFIAYNQKKKGSIH
jgi:hypothetical protein